MKVVEMKVGDLIPYERNPRNNEKAVDAVAASIKQFGFRVPLVVDKENVVVAGHTRLLAAKQLGLKKVPCTVAEDLTEDQIRAYRLADNKLSELATWDFGMLNEELDEITMDMAQFGFELPDDDYVDSFFEPDPAPEQESEEGLESTEIRVKVYSEDKKQLCEDFFKENEIEYKVK